MQFKNVASYFAQIERESSRLAIMKLLAELLKEADPYESFIITHLSLGELHAPYRGTQFNLAQKSMVPIVAQLLTISIEKLHHEMRTIGDLGEIIAQEGTWEVKNPLTVREVYTYLSSIEEISGTGSQERKASACLELLQMLDPLSAKYVVRMILGTLRLGFSDMTIIDALSWMIVGSKKARPIIENAYNICVDIGLIAETLKEKGLEALERMKIHVGIPIRPAAAERLPDAQEIIDKLGACVAQPKIDGFRLQIHLDKTKKTIIKFFSRNVQDMSYMFPDIADAFVSLNVETLIAEGEAIGFDANTGEFLPFQETVKRKRKHGISQAQTEFPLKLFLFDLLYLNGESLLGYTHAERRQQLIELLKGFKSDIVQIIEERQMHSAKELVDYFNEAIAEGLEGLVIKRPDSPYQPGKRNFNWIKLKRESEGELEDSIDCVVLGYYSGRGKRAQFGIGAFLVGVYNKHKDCFQTVAKIGTGLTDQEWIDLKKKCDKIQVDHKPVNVECSPQLEPYVWVLPEIVCEIRADEITISPTHTAGKTEKHMGLALRFPRFMNYRIDKSPIDATTVDELKRLYEDQFAKK